jgi:chorismate mutase
MLQNLMARLSSRENVLAALAQGAVTWGSNHLAVTIANQSAELDELRAELEQSTTAFVELALERDVLADELAETKEILAGALHDLKHDDETYPTLEDVAPLGVRDLPDLPVIDAVRTEA